MDTIFTLKIILLLIMLFSALIGFAKWSDFKYERRQNRRNLEERINNRQTTRRLTSEELELITPYLTNKKLVKPYKLQSSLVNSEVSIIEGDCVRHSLYTDSKETEFYYKIDGIEVLFPYHLQLFALDYNVVEVVFTSRYAIAVSFNGYGLDTLADFSDNSNDENNKYGLSFFSNLSRTIREEEYQLLEPYLNDPSMVGPYEHGPSLVSPTVSVIVGSCIAINQSNKRNDPIYTYRIGDTVVFFPYDMEQYVEDINIVQVVFTEHYAIVIKLNQCDLKTAQQNQKQPNLKPHFAKPWESQKAEVELELEQNLTDANDSIIKIDKDTELKSKFTCEIVEQREETPLESANRSKKNNGIFAAVFLVVAAMLFAKYWYSFDSFLPVFIALSLSATAFFYFRKAESYTLDVNHIKTKIRHKNEIKNQMIVGDDLTLKYPAYWAPFLPDKTNENIDMDIVANSKKLLRYGNSLSISREIEEFGPPKFIMRNLILFVTALILSISIFKLVNITDNLTLASYPFNDHVSIWNIKDAESLKNSPIKKGDLVNIKLNGASCNAQSNMYLEHCDKVFINEQTANNAEDASFENDLLYAFFGDKLIETARDNDVTELEKQLNNRKNTDYNEDYQFGVILTKLLHIDRIILTVDESCQLLDEDKCRRAKQILLQTIKPTASTLDQWPQLVEYSKQHPNYEKIIVAGMLEHLEPQINNLKRSVLSYYLEKANTALTDYQHSAQSVGLALANTQEIKISYPDDKDISLTETYYNALLGKGGKVKVSGLVTGVNYQSDNTILDLTINDDFLYRFHQEQLLSFTSPIFIGISIFIITALIALLHGITICYKLIANRQRKNKIIKSYENKIT
ncbi:IgaA/UmoB family intracellular growth attenuator [Gilliamella sp. ESL0254]|uniref:IgaA/UmoB family intracellular growth attenuator n=1 Tax=Gilliamella sp. ESL0254 TaxID=2705035 RepID=UPI0015800D71|nr:IgaA/UmoB family intracellular growth attenuator [Gilliamella sp. ESL0254]NUF27241.1 intracellular growth attenuator family protein [Gilliamella sp. ESL0254]